jgi:PIN domain nuclease of toxin-antitoxin system
MRTIFEHRPLVLDTHVWIWLVQGDPTLAPETRDLIRAAANAGNLRIAAVTLWEVAILASHSRIELGEQTLPWLEDAVTRSGTVVEPLTPRVAAESYQLPGSFHRDPADRMIVATSRLVRAALMTRDREILNYAAQGHLTAIAA